MPAAHATFHELPPFHPFGWDPRPVRAYVPPGRSGPRPVLLLFDGQNVFGDEGSYAGGWHAHHAVERLGERTFTRPIVVGVGHGGVRRIEELGTGGPRFVDAVVTDLLPRVFERFEVSEVIPGGASLGGLAALLGWLRHPDVFSGALVMSPSLWFGHRALLHHLDTGAVTVPRTGRVYVDAGAKERGRMLLDATHLSGLLQARGLGDDRLLWRPDPRGAHHERHWRRRLLGALRFLFRRQAGRT